MQKSKVTQFAADNYFAPSHLYNMANFPRQQNKFNMRWECVKLLPILAFAALILTINFFSPFPLDFFLFRSPLLSLSVCFEILKLYLCRCWKLTMGWWFFLLYQLNVELSVWVHLCMCVRGADEAFGV